MPKIVFFLSENEIIIFLFIVYYEIKEIDGILSIKYFFFLAFNGRLFYVSFNENSFVLVENLIA